VDYEEDTMPKKQPESVGEVDVCIELQARLSDLGFEFDPDTSDLSGVLDALQQVTLTMKHPTDEQVVEYARRALAKEGEIEIDADNDLQHAICSPASFVLYFAPSLPINCTALTEVYPCPTSNNKSPNSAANWTTCSRCRALCP